MLFNSYIFLLGYLPIVLVAFFVLGRWSRTVAAAWLACSSLFFYAWWNPRYVLLLLASITFNYVCGRTIARCAQTAAGKRVLTFAVTVNLLLLCYYKYTGFFLSSMGTWGHAPYGLLHIVLPLGISFFTFTQIAFLVDAYRGLAMEYSPVHYLLFVTYFPHLIAGPILHHKQMMPQFADPEIYRPRLRSILPGLAFLAIGMAKKVLLADNLAYYADRLFRGVEVGLHPGPVLAWTGVLAYAFQLYFDFSGYCDMAIGLSKLFGIDLPVNFDSPYKSVNIVDFWRRWHITLSHFLRDYLYFPLGGNRKGKVMRYRNLMITMLLGGLWHGANWTFVVWGGLHGIYLVINHAWLAVKQSAFPGWAERSNGLMARVRGIAATAVTFVSVLLAWVFFRADSFHAAGVILKGLAFGFRHTSDAPQEVFLWLLFAVSVPVVWLMPNSQTLVGSMMRKLEKTEAGLPAGLVWTAAFSLLLGALGGAAILQISAVPSKFIYFQF
ncbi:MBOAT family O-acyltransferase [Silvibacterium dinghuense]|uniref:MBOAT family protein n=1 Tax=Silvibacterium dinghuense TaxID=1560006 RepID=A0A4Q1SBY4_9BACT|nr:MBOAT family O-acyltransferase [Silvibacterium dinghuense]RXS94513.1 MBOAT family protein [Silvibacterium dinghuense]GGH15643.1 alginate O-acetylation protein [Silvibacterium dinghuense]